MSLYYSPYFMDYERPRRHPRHLLNQHFGLGLTPQDELTIIAIPQPNRDYYRPWRNLQAAQRDTGSTIKLEKDKFQVNLDVQHFAPEELSVKTADGFLIVEAKHEEKPDEHGFISRSFVRKYALPKDVNPDLLNSRLSSDGVLSITAPLKTPLKESNERNVPIIQTGPVKKQIEEKQQS